MTEQPEVTKSDEVTALVGWGVVTAVAVPPIGVVLGIILAAKGQVTSGVVVMFFALVCAAMWMQYL